MARLSSDQIRRATEVFQVTHPGQEDRLDGWIAGFENDPDAESEIRLWEWVANALRRYQASDGYDPNRHADVMSMMIGRTGFPSADKFLSINPPTGMSLEEAKRILGYMDVCRDESVPAGASPVRVASGPSTPMLDRVVAHLEARGLRGRRPEGTSIFVFPVELENGRYECSAETNERAGALMFHTWWLAKVPKEMLGPILIVTAQINAQHAQCTFVYHFNSRRVSCRTGLVAPLALVGEDLLGPVVDASLQVMDLCCPHLEGVAEGRLTPSQARDAIFGA